MSLAPPTTVYRNLHQLASKVHQFKSRVEFLVLAFKYGVVREITSYELWDRGYEGLGERQFDTCFEMGDSEEVIAELIRAARTEGTPPDQGKQHLCAYIRSKIWKAE